MNYAPDQASEPWDLVLASMVQDEPVFDRVTADFLLQTLAELRQRCTQSPLLAVTSTVSPGEGDFGLAMIRVTSSGAMT